MIFDINNEDSGTVIYYTFFELVGDTSTGSDKFHYSVRNGSSDLI